MFTQSLHRQAAAVSFKFKLTGQNNSAALGFHGQEFFLLSGVYVCVCVFVCVLFVLLQVMELTSILRLQMVQPGWQWAPVLWPFFNSEV